MFTLPTKIQTRPIGIAGGETELAASNQALVHEQMH
jgi:hypothetical protein